ncbi:hypothetical protein CASFOL_042145 [Castilleja foliolosa]|uniref:Uncharacterized protein n=1 Tax=Castilleja foliolosa TaxID=1961234 RepID=A0ABD3BAH7_9LAMI
MSRQETMNKELSRVKREVGESMARKVVKLVTEKYTLGILVETYFGQPLKQWTSGIRKGDSHKQMKLLMSTAARFFKMKKVKAVKLGLDDVMLNELNRKN